MSDTVNLNEYLSRDVNEYDDDSSVTSEESFVSATSESSTERKERYKMSEKNENKSYHFDRSNVEKFVTRMRFGLMG